MSPPSVSVVITHYDRLPLLHRGIESVLAQGSIVREILVVDDCTPNVEVAAIRAQLPSDPRIELLRPSRNGGAQAARNLGIERASCEYIALMDSDDEWLPGKVDNQVEHLVRHGLDLVACRFYYGLGDTRRPDRRRRFEGSAADYILRKGGHLQTSTMLLRAPVAKAIRFDPAVSKYQDWDFVFRVERAGWKVGLLDEYLSIYHFGHGTQMTGRPAPERLLDFLVASAPNLPEKSLAYGYTRVLARTQVEAGMTSLALRTFLEGCRRGGVFDAYGGLLLARKVFNQLWAR